MKPKLYFESSLTIAGTGRHRQRGFSMAELLVATAVFLVVSAAAFSLVRQHQPLFNQQQNMVALNVNLRNAMAQLQVDLSNAGTGFYTGANIPAFPIGVTLMNNRVAGSCYDATTHTYSSTCFDSLGIISTDPNTPPSTRPTSAPTASARLALRPL